MTSSVRRSLPTSVPGPPMENPAPTTRLQGKVAIITGANSPQGIGLAAARLFASAGCKALYLTDAISSHLSTHKQTIEAESPNTQVYTREMDSADEAAVKALCEEVVQTWDRLDIMFANAGISGSPLPFWDVGAKEVMEVLRVNTLGAFLCAKYAAMAMREASEAAQKQKGGSIIMTASVAGLRSNAGGTAYSASKSAVISLAQTLAYQLTGTGVRVNALCPGIIETGMTAPMYEMARKKGTDGKIGQLNPLRRGGIAREVAALALFLATEEASYINGQAWAVDGGLSAGLPFVPGKLA